MLTAADPRLDNLIIGPRAHHYARSGIPANMVIRMRSLTNRDGCLHRHRSCPQASKQSSKAELVCPFLAAMSRNQRLLSTISDVNQTTLRLTPDSTSPAKRLG
jgi:hypothetical protein